MKKKFSLILISMLALTACEKEDNFNPQVSCQGQAPATLGVGETVTSLQINFVGNMLQACAGTQMPIVVSGVYSSNVTWCDRSKRMPGAFTTNPTDTTRLRRFPGGDCTAQDECLNYNTLDCSNFIFSVLDETTGASVGEVTPACNLVLHANAGKRTVVKATDLKRVAFYPDAKIFNANNVLTCN